MTLVTKRHVDIDDEKLAEVKRILGTNTLKATVDQALQEIIDMEIRVQHLQDLIAMDSLVLEGPETMGSAWQRR